MDCLKQLAAAGSTGHNNFYRISSHIKLRDTDSGFQSPVPQFGQIQVDRYQP